VLRPTFKQLISNPQFAAAQERFGAMANRVASDIKKSTEEIKKTSSLSDSLHKDD
jgi:hypothetical protein